LASRIELLYFSRERGNSFFFFIWGAFHESNDERLGSARASRRAFVLGAAVFLREVILRKARLRYLQAEKLLDYNFQRRGYRL
jgi:hypothetical protein